MHGAYLDRSSRTRNDRRPPDLYSVIVDAIPGCADRRLQRGRVCLIRRRAMHYAGARPFRKASPCMTGNVEHRIWIIALELEPFRDGSRDKHAIAGIADRRRSRMLQTVARPAIIDRLQLGKQAQEASRSLELIETMRREHLSAAALIDRLLLFMGFLGMSVETAESECGQQWPSVHEGLHRLRGCFVNPTSQHHQIFRCEDQILSDRLLSKPAKMSEQRPAPQGVARHLPVPRLTVATRRQSSLWVADECPARWVFRRIIFGDTGGTRAQRS